MKEAIDSLATQPEALNEFQQATTNLLHSSIDAMVSFVPKFIILAILFFVGLRLINLLVRVVKSIMAKRGVDPSVIRFVAMITGILCRIFLILTIINHLGIAVTSFIAMLGAAGLAVGMALQGTLQNFAGGIIILILKPFKTGDDIEYLNQRGIVKEIRLFNTVIEKAGTNENVIVPNGSISSNTVTNWTKERNRRIDISFGVGYGSDLSHIKQMIVAETNKDQRIVCCDQTLVLVTNLGDNAVIMELRTWVRPGDYLQTRSDLIELIYNKLNEHNIDIPFPQVTIHQK